MGEWIFKTLSGKVAYGTKIICKFVGKLSLTPSIQEFFYCLKLCLLAKLQKRVNSFSWYFQDASDMTQGIIAYIILGLTRVFHSPQTRRGGGLRSWGDSCFIMLLEVYPWQYFVLKLNIRIAINRVREREIGLYPLLSQSTSSLRWPKNLWRHDFVFLLLWFSNCWKHAYEWVSFSQMSVPVID